jgi:Kef-type K+ transport system membrane component KefB
VFGLAIPRHADAMQVIRTGIISLTNGLLIPVFFAFTGLHTNLLTLIHIEFILPSIMMIFLAFVGKYVIGLLVMRSSGSSWGMASAMGALMNARGLMEIIMANIGLVNGYISVQCYSMLMLLAIVSTLLALPIYDWSLRRTDNMNMLSVPANSG